MSSLGVFRYSGYFHEEGSKLVTGLNVCDEKFYYLHWSRAVKDTKSRLFKYEGKFSTDDIEEVMAELERQKEWAAENLSGDDLDYMYDRIEDLEEQLPEECEKDGTEFYIF